MFKLTPRQLEALPHIEWLFNDNRDMSRVGRTTLMAYYFINKAIRTGELVKPFDHDMPYSFEYNARSVIPVIKTMFQQYYSEKYQILWEHSTSRFQIKER